MSEIKYEERSIITEDAITAMESVMLPEIVKQINDNVSKTVRVCDLLQKIIDWGPFPDTGRHWEDGQPMSYGVVNGSNGERDYMRNIASDAYNILILGEE